MLEPERTSGSKVSHWFIELHPTQHACMLCILTSSLAHIRACDYLVSPSSYRADRSVGARYGIPKDWRAWLHVESTPARSISEWTATPSVVAECEISIVPNVDDTTTEEFAAYTSSDHERINILRHAASDQLFRIRLDQTNGPIKAEALLCKTWTSEALSFYLEYRHQNK